MQKWKEKKDEGKEQQKARIKMNGHLCMHNLRL